MLFARSSSLLSDYNYSILKGELINTKYILRKLKLRTRFQANYQFGKNLAPESQTYLAGASPEQMMDTKYNRSITFTDVFASGLSTTRNFFHQGGGLNVRGFNHYYAPSQAGSNQQYLFAGKGGLSFNGELDFNSLFNFQPKLIRNFLSLQPYLFYDAASIVYDDNQQITKLSNVYMDAGVGIGATIKKWGALTKEAPLTIRFDVPFFVSPAPFTESDNFQFRWLLGVGRCF